MKNEKLQQTVKENYPFFQQNKNPANKQFIRSQQH